MTVAYVLELETSTTKYILVLNTRSAINLSMWSLITTHLNEAPASKHEDDARVADHCERGAHRNKIGLKWEVQRRSEHKSWSSGSLHFTCVSDHRVRLGFIRKRSSIGVMMWNHILKNNQRDFFTSITMLAWLQKRPIVRTTEYIGNEGHFPPD